MTFDFRELTFASARTFRNTIAMLALLVGACDSGGSPSAALDGVTGSKSSRDASAAKKRDAGRAVADEAADDEATDDEAEAAGDDGDMGVNTADAGALTPPSRRNDASAANTSNTAGDSGVATGAAPSCDGLTYESFGKAFVTEYCTECHTSKNGTAGLGGIALDTLPLVMKNKMYLKRSVVPRTDHIEPPMPKGGNPKLTDAERTKFGAWIDCGPM